MESFTFFPAKCQFAINKVNEEIIFTYPSPVICWVEKEYKRTCIFLSCRFLFYFNVLYYLFPGRLVDSQQHNWICLQILHRKAPLDLDLVSFGEFRKSWFWKQNLVFRPGKTGFWFFSTRAIDSEHGQRGVCKFIAPRMHFENFDLWQLFAPLIAYFGAPIKKYHYITSVFYSLLLVYM